MDSFDDTKRLRILQDSANQAASRRGPTTTRGAPCVVAKVLAGSASAPACFQMEAYDLTGTLVEGAAGTLTDAGYSFFATNLGSAVPAVGTAVLCTFVDYRWAFRYDN